MASKFEFIVHPSKLIGKGLMEDKIEIMMTGSYTLDSLDIDIQNYRFRELIKDKWIQALEKNSKLRPGLKFRLQSSPQLSKFSPAAERFRGSMEAGAMRLELGMTDYGLFMATNKAAMEDPEYAKLLMKEAKRIHNDEYAFFSSPLGNCAIVESSNNKIALITRAKGSGEYSGYIDTPGGHANPAVHGFMAEGQFRAMKDETSEEIGIPFESIEEIYLIGICINKENFGKPDMLFYLRSGVSSNQWKFNEEVSKLEKLTKDQLFGHLTKGTYSLVPPSQALMVAYFSKQNNYDVKDFSFLKQ